MARSKTKAASPKADELERALLHGDAKKALGAARRIAQDGLAAYEQTLHAAFASFTGASGRADPGCLVKEAVIEALDKIESGGAEVFAEAARYVQIERVKGQGRDVAGRLRARGVLGIARLGHVDALAIFGACLGDGDPSVRIAAARAVGHRGARDGVGLLLLRLGADDREPEVLMACVRGLFALAPDLAVPAARALLEADDARRRALVLSALGTAPHDEAVILLIEALSAQTLASDRKAVVDAIGLSLRPRARTFLIELAGSERTSDAHAALEALSIHRYDARLVDALRVRTAQVPALAARFAELFSG